MLRKLILGFVLVLVGYAAGLTMAVAYAGAESFKVIDGTTYRLTDEYVNDPLINWSVRQAEAYWGQPVCRTQWRMLEVYRPNVSEVEAAGFGGVGNCDHWINERYLVMQDPERVCALITHELGHNLGRNHDDADPAMANVVTYIPPQCRQRPLLPLRALWTSQNQRWCKKHRTLCIDRYYRLYAQTFALQDAWIRES